MNPITLQNIAQALWMKEYDAAKIPPGVLERIQSAVNSEAAYAKRFLQRLQQLEENPLSFVPGRAERYALLRQHLQQTSAMSPREFYASCLFLGEESNAGYAPVPLDPSFPFPQTDLPQLQHQLGWHFFVGNFTDARGHHYSIELMFWQYALLPPPLAAELGLSDIENQSLEMHLAICDPQTGQQYRANTVVVAGTTGLVEVGSAPFVYRIGHNAIEGLKPGGDLFPVRLQARGWDMGKPADVEFGIDISLENAKGYFMQGDEGCSPSIDGLGTLYYSASLLKLLPGAANVITIDGRRIELTDGSMWYDHQWTAGFMPKGGARHAVLRAASNLAAAPPGGWDWFEVQFQAGMAPGLGEVQMTISALHTLDNAQFYWQTGATPPGTMTARFNGKYIDAGNVTANLSGTMAVTAWVKDATSPNPGVYPATHTWYPAHYHFSLDPQLPGTGPAVPQRLRTFTLEPLIGTGQSGFFGTGLQYTEGGAIARDLAGAEIGRGFAEGTNWAHSADTVVAAAGLVASEQTRALLTPVPPSAQLVVDSMAYTQENALELLAIMKSARGMV